MTEKKRYSYSVHKHSIEYNKGKHFAYFNGEELKIIHQLNKLSDKNEQLKQFQNIARDYNIPFDKLSDTFEDILNSDTITDIKTEIVMLKDDSQYYKIKSGECEEELLYLRRENKQLKSKLSEQDIQLDFLQDESADFRLKYFASKQDNEELKIRNSNQYNQLNQLWTLIEAEDWETLIAMNEQMKKDEEQLQREWACYE